MSGRLGVIVTLDGEMHPPQTPLLFADDLAAVRGDGVFETLLVRDGRACLVESHLRRLTSRPRDGPAQADLPRGGVQSTWRRGQWAAGTAEEGALRLMYSRGRESGSAPTAYLMVNPVAERVAATRRDGLAAVMLDRGLPSTGVDAMPWLLAGAKTLSYAVNMAALRHAAHHGAGDVVFVSSDGCILEGPRSTVVIAAESEAGADGNLPVDTAAVVSDPAWHHPAGPVRGCPRQGLRLRLSRVAGRGSVCCARGLAGVEHDLRGTRAHAGRSAAAQRPRWPRSWPNWSTPR